MFKNWNEVLDAIANSPELLQDATLTVSKDTDKTGKPKAKSYYVKLSARTPEGQIQKAHIGGMDVTASSFGLTFLAYQVCPADKDRTALYKPAQAKAATLSLAELRERL